MSFPNSVLFQIHNKNKEGEKGESVQKKDIKMRQWGETRKKMIAKARLQRGSLSISLLPGYRSTVHLFRHSNRTVFNSGFPGNATLYFFCKFFTESDTLNVHFTLFPTSSYDRTCTRENFV